MAFKMFPPAPMTAQGISTQRQIANALLQQGMDTSPVGHWTQGAARVAQALLGGYKGQQAEQAAQQLQQQEEAKAQAARAEAEQRAQAEAAKPEYVWQNDAWWNKNAPGGPLQVSQAIQKSEEIKKLNDSMLYKQDGKGGVEWITPPGGAAAASDPYAATYDEQFAKDSAKKNAELGRKITSAGLDAQSQMNSLDRTEQLASDPEVYQGTGAQFTLPIRRAMSAIPGLNQLPYSSPEAVAKSDEFASLSNAMALMVRNPDAGLGMPGALSDKDREFLVSTVPGLSRSPGGNKLMIEAAKRVQKRKIEIADFKAQYVAENKRLDDRFFEIVSKWSQDNPMFEDLATATGAPAAQPGQADKPKFVVPITSDEEFDALPSGAFFKGPDGKTRQKP